MSKVKSMDRELANAAKSGNVEFLRATLAVCQQANNGEGDYNSSFLSHYFVSDVTKEIDGNIFHLAAGNGREEFFKEAMRSLPKPLVHLLLCQLQPNDTDKLSPLHVAAGLGHVGIVKLILGFYDSDTKFEPKPWLVKAFPNNDTPLHRALCHDNKKEECAMEILMWVDDDDKEALCNIVNSQGYSPLTLAVLNGCNRVAMYVLTSVRSYSTSSIYGGTPLHCVMNSSEEVCKRLLERHSEFIKVVDTVGATVLHRWAGYGKLWPLEYILKRWEDISIAHEVKRHLAHLIYSTDKNGDNPFHIAAKLRKDEVARTLASVYREERAKELASISSSEEAHHHLQLPWLVPNDEGQTPMDLVMTNYILYSNEYSRLLRMITDMKPVKEGKSELLFLAIEKELYFAAEAIWDIQLKYGWSLYPPGGFEIWHAALNFSEEAAIWMAERFPSVTSNPNEVVAYILNSVSEIGATRIVESMLKKNSFALKLAPLAWIGACQKGHFLTVMAFVNNSLYFRELCLEKKDTPLHHIQFEMYEQYQDILKNPIISGLKNFQDFNGETPLHKAIRKRNLLFTRVLLTTDDVSRSINDKENNTAMNLLIRACNESWEWNDMCKSVGIIPGLRMTYFQDKPNLLEVRNTLSVLAALLATITFTAGFTPPGGVKSDSTGKATLADKAPFLVFLLADALAMCCSMLVLVCLIWSMVCDYNKSLLLIDRSVPMLMLALYSTVVTFMTGVFIVIPHKSLWVAIVILVMCSLFIILFKRSIMDMLLDKLYPALNRKYKDEIQMMEQGEATTFQEGSNSWVCGKPCIRLRARSSQ